MTTNTQLTLTSVMSTEMILSGYYQIVCLIIVALSSVFSPIFIILRIDKRLQVKKRRKECPHIPDEMYKFYFASNGALLAMLLCVAFLTIPMWIVVIRLTIDITSAMQ